MRRGEALALLGLLAAPQPLDAQQVTRRMGQVTIGVETRHSYPGGLLVVKLRTRRRLGTTYAVFEGRRAPVQSTPGGLRALVPIPATSPAGTGVLGIEVLARRGSQRTSFEFPIAERVYPARMQTIPEEKRTLLQQPASLRDGRRLLLALRTLTPKALWSGPFRPPVAAAPVASFGGRETYLGGSPVEMMMDGGFGERHRGLDYAVPPGTLVQAPAAGAVGFAGALLLTGNTLVLDHGHGVVSAFYHLGRIEVREGEAVEARAPLGLSGESGLALFPHLHWGVYVHGIAVDPRALEILEE